MQIFTHDDSVHSGSELDLLFFANGKRIGVEIKRTNAPKLTKSMKVSLRDLTLDTLYVIYPGELEFSLAEGAHAIPFDKARKTIENAHDAEWETNTARNLS